jgi:NitT/TauT family transport system ATP-binding protein
LSTDRINQVTQLYAVRPPPILVVHDLNAIFSDNGNGGSGAAASGAFQALGGVTFSVFPQEFVCVLGPSGSGKSTLLRILAGLLTPASGSVEFSISSAMGQTVTRPRIGVVFQQANLMPWRTVLQNIMLPMEIEGTSREEARHKAQEMIELVRLEGFESAWPRDLSGGMAQRVAIARALVHDPDILLLDEPFASLDALTRERMWSELSRIWQARQKTVIMVTHSIGEALFLSDRVLVLTARPGKVKLDLPVDLPRPRQEEMRYTPHFSSLTRRLKRAIE